MSRPWRGRYPVHTYELNRGQRVSFPALCSYIIDAAGYNAYALGFSIPQLLLHHRTWFLARLLVRIHAYPGWRDTVTVETWPSGIQGLLALRDWRLFVGRRPIGEATSGWMMVDYRTRRPLRPESYADWSRIIRPRRAIPHRFTKLSPLEPGGSLSAEREYAVRFADLDINNHADYLAFIGWVLEGVGGELRAENEIAEMEIDLLAEANYGQLITTVTQSSQGAEGEPVVLHRLTRREDGVELARARTRWRPAPEAR